jgi:hypothetical protein
VQNGFYIRPCHQGRLPPQQSISSDTNAILTAFARSSPRRFVLFPADCIRHRNSLRERRNGIA